MSANFQLIEKGHTEKRTNSEYAEKERLFYKLCQEFGVEPSRRQASKFRRGTGCLYKKAFLGTVD